MKRLSERKKHLKTFVGGHAPPEDGQHFPQGPPRKADSGISTPGLCFAYGQADSPAPRPTKIRATDRMR